MCTLTILSVGEVAGSRALGPAGMRMACNRDESRTRPTALPPVIRAFGTRRAILPIDPVGGGTWIAVNDAGLAASLLNFYSVRQAGDPRALPRPDAVSRGTIIPQLMPCPTLDSAVAELGRVDPTAFQPFRLVFTDGCDLVEVTGDSCRLSTTRRKLGADPVMFASSGLGDEIVDGPRRDVFREMLGPGPDMARRQDAYHRHSWPDRRHLSVCMSRPDARTVSYTVVQTESDRVSLTYYGDAPDSPVTPARLELPRQGP